MLQWNKFWRSGGKCLKERHFCHLWKFISVNISENSLKLLIGASLYRIFWPSVQSVIFFLQIIIIIKFPLQIFLFDNVLSYIIFANQSFNCGIYMNQEFSLPIFFVALFISFTKRKLSSFETKIIWNLSIIPTSVNMNFSWNIKLYCSIKELWILRAYPTYLCTMLQNNPLQYLDNYMFNTLHSGCLINK